MKSLQYFFQLFFVFLKDLPEDNNIIKINQHLDHVYFTYHAFCQPLEGCRCSQRSLGHSFEFEKPQWADEDSLLPVFRAHGDLFRSHSFFIQISSDLEKVLENQNPAMLLNHFARDNRQCSVSSILGVVSILGVTFFLTTMTGEAQGLCNSWMIPVSFSSTSYSRRSSRSLNRKKLQCGSQQSLLEDYISWRGLH